jgi:hypothetical protein
MTVANAHSPAGPAVNAAAATRALVRAALVALAVTAAMIAIVLALLGRADYWQGFAAASVLSALAAGASVGAMRLGLAYGVQGAMAGHFGGVLVRLLIVLGGGLMLVWAGGYPAATLILCVPYYFATLGAEVVAMVTFFRSMEHNLAR